MVDTIDRNQEQLVNFWEEFMSNNPDKVALMRAIRTIRQCRIPAWEALMRENVPGGPPTNVELVSLMQDVYEIYDLIWEELRRRNPGVEELVVS